MFKLVVWGGFFLAMSLTGWGLWRMEVNGTYKALLGVSWLYSISKSSVHFVGFASRTSVLSSLRLRVHE